MQSAQLGRRRRVMPAVVSSAALALALVGAGGASAQDALPGPSATVAPHTSTVKTPVKELRQRLITAAKATATPATATAKPGAATPFIIGGSATTIGAAPWMVQLGYSDPATGDGYFCGGALVAPDKVLTAAHCVAGLDWEHNGAVLAGATDVEDDSTGTVAGVVRQWNHPHFSPDTLQNDVAVLTLDRPLTQSWLRLAASGDSSLYTPGTTGTVYGWGLTSGADGSDLSSTLKKATLPLVSDATCDSAMGSVLGEDDFVAGSMVCAGTPATGGDAGTTTTCNGDSGGPLVVGGKVAGIVSWGVQGCTAQGSYPVFTKVSSYAWAAQPRVDDSDLSGDGKADLMGRTPSGGLFEMDSKGTSLAQRAFAGSGWQSASWIVEADLDHDGVQDLISREADGALYWEHPDYSTGEFVQTKITTVWGGYKSYAIPGDFTGDGKADLIAVDSNGDTYLYPGRANGEFSAKVKVVSGSWKGVKVFGGGDLSGDGKADLLVRDSSNTLWLYRSTGVAAKPFAARVKAGTGWSFTAVVSDGDVTGDGVGDVFARASNGTLYLYPGTDKAATPFGARISLGTGFNQYNLLF